MSQGSWTRSHPPGPPPSFPREAPPRFHWWRPAPVAAAAAAACRCGWLGTPARGSGVRAASTARLVCSGRHPALALAASWEGACGSLLDRAWRQSRSTAHLCPHGPLHKLQACRLLVLAFPRLGEHKRMVRHGMRIWGEAREGAPDLGEERLLGQRRACMRACASCAPASAAAQLGARTCGARRGCLGPLAGRRTSAGQGAHKRAGAWAGIRLDIADAHAVHCKGNLQGPGGRSSRARGPLCCCCYRCCCWCATASRGHAAITGAEPPGNGGR